MCVCKGRHGDAIDRQAEVMYFLKPVGLFVLLSFFFERLFLGCKERLRPRADRAIYIFCSAISS